MKDEKGLGLMIAIGKGDGRGMGEKDMGAKVYLPKELEAQYNEGDNVDLTVSGAVEMRGGRKCVAVREVDGIPVDGGEMGEDEGSVEDADKKMTQGIRDMTKKSRVFGAPDDEAEGDEYA